MSGLRKTSYPRPPGAPASTAVARLFTIIDQHGYTYPSLETNSRVANRSLGRWRYAKCDPSIGRVEAVAWAMGYEIVFQPIGGVE